MSVGRNLPDGYTQIEYIRHNNIGYIDTGVSFGPSIRVKADYQIEKHYYGFEAAIAGIYSDESPLTRLKIGLNANGAFSYYNDMSCIEGTNATVYSQKESNLARTQAIAYPRAGYSDVSTDHIYIFCQYKNGTTPTYYGNNFVGKLYSMQIYDAYTLVRDYVPAERDSDNKIGLYDVVNNTFVYENISLPSGYEHVSYLGSSGTQYINTSEVPGPKTGFFADFKSSNIVGSSSYGAIFGSSDSETGGIAHPNAFYLNTYTLNSDLIRGTFARGNDTAVSEIDAGITSGSRISAGFSSVTRSYVRGDCSYDALDAETDTINGTYPIYIFANNYGGTISEKASMQLHSLIIYGGTNGYDPIHIYIPVLYTEEYVIDQQIVIYTTPGLYDVVDGQFLQNGGSGSFTYGSEVVNYSEAGPVVITDKYHVNRVEYPDGTVLIDLTQDTVVSEKLYAGLTAHAANGEIITGTAEVLDDNQGNVTLPPGLVTITGG